MPRHTPNDDKRAVQIYTPVRLRDGEEVVRVTNERGDFYGWLGSRARNDTPGEWEVMDTWTEKQDEEFRIYIKRLKREFRGIDSEAEPDGVSRRVTFRF